MIGRYICLRIGQSTNKLPSAIAKHLSANVFTNRCGSIQLEQHVSLQQVLGSVHLKVGEAGAEAHPLVLDVEDHVILVQGVGDKVDAPQAGVLEM